ncbi:hypothetical protein GW17_00047962 [Ensete ventricosum]|nr:hypothetical protein GW17_00047962 [Ensete ventricosum]
MSCSVLCSTGRVYRNDKLLLSWLAIPFPLSPPTPPFSPSSTTTMYSNFGSSDISKNLRTRIKKPKKNRKPRPKIQRGSKQAGGEIQRRGQCRGLIDEIGVSDETATTPGGERPWRGGIRGGKRWGEEDWARGVRHGQSSRQSYALLRLSRPPRTGPPEPTHVSHATRSSPPAAPPDPLQETPGRTAGRSFRVGKTVGGAGGGEGLASSFRRDTMLPAARLSSGCPPRESSSPFCSKCGGGPRRPSLRVFGPASQNSKEWTPDAGAFILGVKGRPYLKSLIPMLLTMLSYSSTSSVVLVVWSAPLCRIDHAGDLVVQGHGDWSPINLVGETKWGRLGAEVIEYDRSEIAWAKHGVREMKWPGLNTQKLI